MWHIINIRMTKPAVPKLFLVAMLLIGVDLDGVEWYSDIPLSDYGTGAAAREFLKSSKQVIIHVSLAFHAQWHVPTPLIHSPTLPTATTLPAVSGHPSGGECSRAALTPLQLGS